MGTSRYQRWHCPELYRKGGRELFALNYHSVYGAVGTVEEVPFTCSPLMYWARTSTSLASEVPAAHYEVGVRVTYVYHWQFISSYGGVAAQLHLIQLESDLIPTRCYFGTSRKVYS
jgi:hypothetical protein